MSKAIGYLCSSSSWGGLEMNQLKNALWMQERGHSVYLFCKNNTQLYSEATQAGIPTITIESHIKYYDFKAGKRLAQLIDLNKISHVIVRDTRDMSVAVIAKRKSKNTIHLSYFMEMQLGVKKTNLFHTIRFSYFDCWSCPLDWLHQQVLSMTKMNSKKVVTIPSGLDLRQFQSSETKETARMKLDLPKDMLILGLVGRFDPQKGQLLLLEALSKIENPNVSVCLLGEPTKDSGTAYLDQIESIIQEKGLKERVFIRPFRKDISTFYFAMDAFVMASKAETFGMVTIESMACGTPVIASNAGGSPEILNFGAFGLLFEPMNAESLALKIEEFIDQPNRFLSGDLKNEARKYDHTSICEKVESTLQLV